MVSSPAEPEGGVFESGAGGGGRGGRESEESGDELATCGCLP